MPSRAHSMPSFSASADSVGAAAASKVQPEVWRGFSRKKAQNLIVEHVLPTLRFKPKRGGAPDQAGPGIWPAPPSKDEAGAIERTFRETSDRLRGLGVSDVVELRSAGSLVVRLNEDQVNRLAEWPMIRKVYANTSL